MTESVERLHFSEADLRQSGGRTLHQYGVHSTYKIHSHDFYEIFFVPRGRAIHTVNGSTQLLSEGSLVLVRPSDTHRYDFFNQADFEMLNAGIPENVFLRICSYLDVDRTLFDAPEIPPHRILSGSALHDVERKLKRNENADSTEENYRYYLGILPYLVSFFLSAPAAEAELPPWLSGLMHKMDAPENFIAGLPCMLSLSGMSQEHLTRSFRRYLNMTPTAFINAKRLNLAAELLLNEQTPVIDVGGLCGFNSQSHFYRLFTERYGCPPKVFRETFRQ